jgi:hypothetical protein
MLRGDPTKNYPTNPRIVRLANAGFEQVKAPSLGR